MLRFGCFYSETSTAGHRSVGDGATDCAAQVPSAYEGSTTLQPLLPSPPPPPPYTDFLCSTLTRIAQNDFLPHNVYVYFLCGLMCTWIHESVAEYFFSDVLTYCVMLQAFICYFSSSDVYDVCACAHACVCYSLALFSAIEHV